MFTHSGRLSKLASERQRELLARASQRRHSHGGAPPQTPDAPTRIPRGLAAALLVAATIVIAACGSTTSSSPATQAAASGPAPRATTSSPAPRANNDYPYEPGGVTYYGAGGAVETFSIPAGTYSLNQQASYDPGNDPDSTGECLFGGELDYLPQGSNGIIPLGDNSAPVTAQVPLSGQSTAPYPAGDYRLHIYPTTTCSWTFELWPAN